VIVDKIPTLGYLLGDEGSGVYLGRLIVQSYYYREMPGSIAMTLKEEYNMGREFVFDQVYHGQRPNSYLATFAEFAFNNRSDPHIKSLVRKNFYDFLHRHILKYKKWLDLPLAYTMAESTLKCL